MDSIGNKKRNTFYINGVISNQSKPRYYNYTLTYNNPSLTYPSLIITCDSPSFANDSLSFACHSLSLICHSLSVTCHSPSFAGHCFSLATPSLRLFLSSASNTSTHSSLILSNNRGFLFSENKILVDDTFNRKFTDKACVVNTLITKYMDLIPKPLIRNLKPVPRNIDPVTLNQQSL